MEFPSPCGVWVVSACSGRRSRLEGFRPLAGCGLFLRFVRRTAGRGVFPSPCGVWVVSFTAPLPAVPMVFPSPCGVWVVSQKINHFCWTARSFRPLAGCGLFPEVTVQVRRKECFRPLAGCGLFRQSCTLFLVQQEKELSTLLFYCIILEDGLSIAN